MRKEPLAYRMRPEKIEDIVGQDHIDLLNLIK